MTDAEKKVLDEEVVVESVDVEVGTMEDVDAIMKKFDRESNTRVWEGTPKLILRYVLAAFMLFMVYMNLWATWSGADPPLPVCRLCRSCLHSSSTPSRRAM